MERRPKIFQESITFIILIIGIIAIGLLLRYTIRVNRGLLGIALGGLSVALLIYWLKEVRIQTTDFFQGFRRQPITLEDLDIVDDGNMITIAGRIQGPLEKIKIGLEGRKLKIIGSNFKEELILKEDCQIKDYSYKNGVLVVNLNKSK